jgi:hypothetical protein
MIEFGIENMFRGMGCCDGVSGETKAGHVDSGHEMSSSSDILPPAGTPHEIPSSSVSMPISMPYIPCWPTFSKLRLWASSWITPALSLERP